MNDELKKRWLHYSDIVIYQAIIDHYESMIDGWKQQLDIELECMFYDDFKLDYEAMEHFTDLLKDTCGSAYSAHRTIDGHPVWDLRGTHIDFLELVQGHYKSRMATFLKNDATIAVNELDVNSRVVLWKHTCEEEE